MKQRSVKNTRAKGYRVENEIVKKLKKAGILAKRVGMSGQLDKKGDIIVGESPDNILQIEVKAKHHLPDWIVKAKEKDNSDILILREDGTKKTLAIISLELLIEFLYGFF